VTSARHPGPTRLSNSLDYAAFRVPRSDRSRVSRLIDNATAPGYLGLVGVGIGFGSGALGVLALTFFVWPAERIVPFVGAVIVVLIALVVAFAVAAAHWTDENRVFVDSYTDVLPAFSAANGFEYHEYSRVPRFAGGLFSGSEEGYAMDRLVWPRSPRFEIGTLPESAFRIADWGYVAIELDSVLPHLLLESVRGDEPGWGLPFAQDDAQAVELEGDLWRHYRVYTTPGRETEALYIFTPDLLALLIDEIDGFHVEIVENWLFLYSRLGFAGRDELGYRRLFEIVDLVQRSAARRAQLLRPALSESAVGRRGPHRLAPGNTMRFARIGGVVVAGIISAIVGAGIAVATMLA